MDLFLKFSITSGKVSIFMDTLQIHEKDDQGPQVQFNNGFPLQILLFGRVVFDHQDFMFNSEEALRHLYFPEWNNLLYTKAYALYSKQEFYDHVDYVLTQVSFPVIKW